MSVASSNGFRHTSEAEINGSRSVPTTPQPHALRKYPFIAQRDESDCAAAALAMIAACHGRQFSLARLRELASVGRQGTTLWSLAQAAEALGFHARGVELEVRALPELRLPAIVHLEGCHFAVLYAIDGQQVLIGDPARGRLQLSMDEFQRSWSRRALEIVPTERLSGGDKSGGSSWRRFVSVLAPMKGMLAEVMAASLLLSALGLGMPLLIQTIIDRVLLQGAIGPLNMLFAGMLILVVFQTVIGNVRQLLVVQIAGRFDARIMSEFFGHLYALPLRFFEARRVGDVISRVTENHRIRGALTGTIPGMVLDVVAALSYFVLLSCYHWKLTLLVLAVLPLLVLLVIAFTPLIRRNERKGFEKRTDASAVLIESITGISTVKALGIESRSRSKLDSLIVDSILTARAGSHLSMLYGSLATTIQRISAGLFLWYGARQVVDGTLTTGQLMAFLMIAGNVTGPILNLVGAWQGLQGARNALDRLDDVFQAPPEQDPQRSLVRLDKLKGGLCFDDVSFRYGEEKEAALSQFSLDIAPGQFVAVVGPTGSGKSTLIKLLLGFYTPTAGRITVDGHDLRTICHTTLRRRIGVVPQEVFLFSGTIAENIGIASEDVTLAGVIEAARLAGAHEFISELEFGYDTLVGDRGLALSGGQRQLIALARALHADPDMLVFDEPTSALDPSTERVFQSRLRAAARTRTTIVVAHRLSTIREADHIVVMDGGQIVESGTHEELCLSGATYSQLVNDQSVNGNGCHRPSQLTAVSLTHHVRGES